jgi:hypothetical protein
VKLKKGDQFWVKNQEQRLNINLLKSIYYLFKEQANHWHTSI